MKLMLAKTRIKAIIILVVSVLAVLPAVDQPVWAREAPAGMELVAENEWLTLYFHPDTTEIAVWDKQTDTMWYSNPPDRNRRKESGHETISILFDTPDADDVELDSFNDSASLDQVAVKPIPNGVRVEYSIGSKFDPERFSIPQAISKKRMEELVLSRLSSWDAKFLLKYYDLVVLTKPEEFEVQPGSELASLEERLFGDYILTSLNEDYVEDKNEIAGLAARIEELSQSSDPEAGEELAKLRKRKEREQSYLQRDRSDLVWELLAKYTGYMVSSGDTATRSQGYRSDVETVEDLSREDFAQLVDNPTYILQRVPVFVKEELAELFRDAGYTAEDLKVDHLANRLEPPIPNIGVFKVPVEYRLDGQELVARIPMAEVEYPVEVPTEYRIDFTAEADNYIIYDEQGERVTYPLHTIKLLPYFGAAGQKEKGYMFVPDGCGALITLNNGKVDHPMYSEPVYGRDASVPLEEKSAYTKKPNLLPVFGLKQGDKALFAVIEEGEAIARIQADIARGSASPYNRVHPTFITIPRTVRVQDQTKITVYQDRLYRGDIQVRYAFLGGEQADYVGMARYYQNYLVERGVLKRLSADNEPPFYLELIGAIPKTRPVMGVPRDVLVPLTTFAGVEEITGELTGRGIENLKVRYSGWLAGGVHHDYPLKVKLADVLGNSGQLGKLQEKLARKGVELYPDVSFLEVYSNRLLDGFTVRRDAARSLNGLVARNHEYDLVTFKRRPDEFSYVLSPSRLDRLVSGFLARFREYGFSGISLADLGSKLNSDFRRDKELVDRQQARDIVARQLQRIVTEAGLKTIVDRASAFALPYTQDIVDVPFESTRYNIADKTVPFLQIVLHGYSNYAGKPLNLASDYERSLLRSIELGAAPYYKWIYSEPSVIKGSEFAHYFDVHYRDWVDEAVRSYREISHVFAGLHHQRIVDHAEIASGVYKTVYEDGTAILVNYNRGPVEIGGLRIDGHGFQRVKGAEEHEK